MDTVRRRGMTWTRSRSEAFASRQRRRKEAMGVLEGKVAFVTGAARGQGRSHAIRLAEEGADIITIDLCAQPETVSVPGSTKEDLEETVRQVEALDRRIVAEVGDIRDLGRMTEVVEKGIAEFGRLDIVLGNAAIWSVGETEPETPEERYAVWRETVDVNLTGQWVVMEATVPKLVEQNEGGAIVLTSSTAGLKSMSIDSLGQTAYTAAKHGVIGLMRNYAVELAKYSIRVNCVAPTSVETPMIQNPVTEKYLAQHPELGDLMSNLLPVPAVEPRDISNGILYLVSDAGRYVTGTTLPVDAGFLVK
jgi:SDR family mycofactocin-dependent oxidoreductase